MAPLPVGPGLDVGEGVFQHCHGIAQFPVTPGQIDRPGLYFADKILAYHVVEYSAFRRGLAAIAERR